MRRQFILSAAQSKGGTHARCILNQRFVRRLETMRDRHHCDPQRPLFASQKGGHFSANTMCQLFLDIYKAVGSRDASSHSGRRTYITRLANKGVGCDCCRAGGAFAYITTQRYIDVNAEQLRKLWSYCNRNDIILCTTPNC